MYIYTHTLKEPKPVLEIFDTIHIETVLSVIVHCSLKAVEKPCPICQTWAIFIQAKLEISIIYSSWDKFKESYVFESYSIKMMDSHVVRKAVWIMISWLFKKPADLNLHCLSLYLVSYCF